MGELQWALLIVCAVLVVALYFFSRRGKADELDGIESDKSADSSAQPDLFARSEASYDEFGVGRPRARGTSAPAAAEPAMPRAATPGVPAPAPGSSALRPPSMGSLLGGGAPASGGRSAPSLLGAAAPAEPEPAAPLARNEPAVDFAAAPLPQPVAEPAPVPRTPPPASTKLVALLVAPIEETDIRGAQLHQALGAQGLRFGAGDLYHRMLGGRIVYSVASLIKPGKLIPAEAERFSTKGLTVILNLPGPVPAEVAFDDMVATTRVLAAALKAEIFDTRRERLTDEIVEALRAEIRLWAAGTPGA